MITLPHNRHQAKKFLLRQANMIRRGSFDHEENRAVSSGGAGPTSTAVGGSVPLMYYSHVTGESQLNREREDQMAIVVQREGEQAKIVSENRFPNEAELQRYAYENPEVLPISDIKEERKSDAVLHVNP